MTKKEKKIYPRSRKEMLRIIKTAEKEGHLLETALEEFTIHPFSMPALWDCREYIWGIGQENYLKKPLIISLLALLSTMAGRLDEAKEYVNIFGETPRHWQAKDFSYNDFCRVSTELVMPYTDDFSFLRIVFFLIDVGAVPVLSLTLSACRPSILNGFRDFTRFGPYLERYRDTVTDTVQKLYGSGGKGVYEILLAEWYYQNNNCFQALVLVTGTIPLMEQERDMRCLFVALALQMKILLVNGQTRTAKPLVEKIRDRIHKTGWEELTSSLNALECIAACYDGRNDEVEEWLEKVAPDENKGIYMMDMYAYLIKIRCYLQTGKYMLAHVFVKQLIILLAPGKRHMDMCECYMLSAMIFHKAGDKKHLCEELEKCLELAEKYNYVRLLADEGNCMVQMLSIYQQEKGEDDFTNLIMELANEVGMRFPDYLKSPAEYFEELTATEKAVLRLMAQGMSNDEIANKMGKKTGTVKFHSNNIFRKLQVQNRQQAVNRGREINLL